MDLLFLVTLAGLYSDTVPLTSILDNVSIVGGRGLQILRIITETSADVKRIVNSCYLRKIISYLYNL